MKIEKKCFGRLSVERNATERYQKSCLTISSVFNKYCRMQKEKRKVLDPPAKYIVRLVQDFDITSSYASLSFLMISWPFWVLVKVIMLGDVTLWGDCINIPHFLDLKVT